MTSSNSSGKTSWTKERIVLFCSAALSVLVLLMKWFRVAALDFLTGQGSFSAIKMIQTYSDFRSYSDSLSLSGAELGAAPFIAICLMGCLVLQIVTMLLIFFNDKDNMYAQSATTGLISAGFTTIAIAVAQRELISLNVWAWIYLLLSVAIFAYGWHCAKVYNK